MNKVVIIDDRKERKKLHLSEAAISSLEKLVLSGKLDVMESINDIEEIANYSLIAVHRSYLINSGVYNNLLDFIKKSNKLLIIFSGNISQNMIMNNGRQLNINASDFYIEKLPEFINRFSEEILESPLLQYIYGDSWKLSLLLQYRYLLWIYGDDVDEIDDEEDESLEERIRSILWNGQYMNQQQVCKEIEIEKTKFHYS